MREGVRGGERVCGGEGREWGTVHPLHSVVAGEGREGGKEDEKER